MFGAKLLSEPVLLMELLGTQFDKIAIRIQPLSFIKLYLKMPSVIFCQPECVKSGLQATTMCRNLEEIVMRYEEIKHVGWHMIIDPSDIISHQAFGTSGRHVI